MQILPADTVATLTTQVTGAITDNAGVIVGVVAFSVALGLILGWFKKTTRQVKAK